MLLGLVLTALPGAAGVWLWRALERPGKLGRTTAWVVAGAAMAAGALAILLERLVLSWTGLSFAVSEAGQAGALLSTFLLAAPLEEAVKVLIVWPLYRAGRIRSAAAGLGYAGLAGAGLAAGELALLPWVVEPSLGIWGRALLSVPAQLFCAGLWGYALGSGRGGRGRWFSLAWLAAMLVHGVYDYIVWGRGAALVVLVVPLLAACVFLGWVALAELRSGKASPRELAPVSHRFGPPPSLAGMRRALQRTDRPLSLVWIAVGTLVTLGVMIAALSGAVYLGHRLGIDFAVADEADVRSGGPVVLLGSAVIAAFPISGYLIARASAATSVFEPALSVAFAIVAVVAALSITAPVAIVFALAAAPVAFALACGGAWIGLDH